MPPSVCAIAGGSIPECQNQGGTSGGQQYADETDIKTRAQYGLEDPVSGSTGSSTTGSGYFEIPGARTPTGDQIYGNPDTYTYTTYYFNKAQIDYIGLDLMVDYNSPRRMMFTFGKTLAENTVILLSTDNIIIGIASTALIDTTIEVLADAINGRDTYEQLGAQFDAVHDQAGNPDGMTVVVIENTYVKVVGKDYYTNSYYTGVYIEPANSSFSRQVWIRNYYVSEIKNYFSNMPTNPPHK